MEILPVGSGVYVIYISEQEFSGLEGASEEATKENTEDLVRRVLGCGGSQTPVEIELYEGHGELMLFATMDCQERAYFAFPDFESVAGACRYCLEPPPSELYWYGGEYILAVSGGMERIQGFGEFGERVSAGELYYMFLREHGKTVICDGAVKFIKNTF